jgi:putative two-component system response regulator
VNLLKPPTYHGPDGTNRILIVDDESIIRDVLRELLGGIFCLGEVDSGEAAIPYLSMNPPDVILADKNLPGMSGLDLLKRSKEDIPETEVIIITGYASLESAIEALRMGAYDYLLKPFDDINIITEKVRRAADKKELTVERRQYLEQLTAANQELRLAQEELEKSYFQTLASMITALEARDAYTRGHSDRVAEFAAAIGWELEFSAERISRLTDGARLHDLGKIGIREDILNKKGALTPEEYEHIKTHSSIGSEILGKVDSYAHLIPMVRHHHERIDGRGYPDGLPGDKIPLEAKIISVADSFDAMISKRPYREPRTEEEAIQILRNVAGTQLDPRIVGAFLATQQRNSKKTN